MKKQSNGDRSGEYTEGRRTLHPIFNARLPSENEHCHTVTSLVNFFTQRKAFILTFKMLH